MNKLMLTLLLLPLPALADIQPDAAREFTRTASAIAAPDWVRVSHRKAATGVDDVGLLTPSRVFFTPTGDLTEKGRELLEKAENFAQQANKKLNVLVPEAVMSKPPAIHTSIGRLQTNAFIGNHVYLFTKD